jgi:hypothetical protein
MMKKILSIALALIMALTMLPVLPVTSSAEDMHTEITFTVENTSGSTFKISRSSSDVAQTVRYRTVSGTAIPGIHYTEKLGTLSFGTGETSKTVTVTETSISNITGADKYQTKSSARYYTLEVFNNIGQTLATCKRTLTSYSSNISVSSYKNKVHDGNFTFTSGGVSYSKPRLADANICGNAFDCYESNGYITIRNYLKDISVISSDTTVTDAGYAQAAYSASTNSIISNTGISREYLVDAGAKMHLKPFLQMHEVNDGYQYIQILVDNPDGCDTGAGSGKPGTPSASAYMCGFEHDSGDSSIYSFPYRSSDNGRFETSETSLNNFVQQNIRSGYSIHAETAGLVVPASAETITFRLNASGDDKDNWVCEYLKLRGMVVDETAPAIKNIYFHSGEYYPGQKMTLSVHTSEVLTKMPTYINTSFGSFHYTSDNGTNVAVYEGAVSGTAGTAFKINGFNYSSYEFVDLIGNSAAPNISKTYSGTTIASYPSPAYVNNTLQITNLRELQFFLQTAASNPSVNAVLLNDINVNPNGSYDTSLQELGTSSNGYLGTFDGNGHTISGDFLLYTSFISKLGTTGVVRNLKLDVGRKYYSSGANAYLCTENYGTIEKCEVVGPELSSVISNSVDSIAVIASKNYGTVRNCKATGNYTIDQGNTTGTKPSVAGIVGTNYGTVEGSLFGGRIVVDLPYNGKLNTVCTKNESGGTITNCYGFYSSGMDYDCYYTNNGTVTATEKVTEAQLASGEVAYKLNGGVTDGTQVWYQNIDNNQTPDTVAQYSGGTVYTHGSIYTNNNAHVIEYVPAVEPTCTSDGSIAHYSCTVQGCEFYSSDENGENPTTSEAVTIPATGHNWTAAVYSWELENGTWECAAERHCLNNSEEIETETVAATGVQSTSPACTANGVTIYTATFTNDAFEEQIKAENDIPAFGHNFTAEWSWNGFESATAVITCSRCNETHTAQAVITQSYDVYTASATYEGQTFTDSVIDTTFHQQIYLGDNTVNATAGENVYCFTAPETAEYRFSFNESYEKCLRGTNNQLISSACCLTFVDGSPIYYTYAQLSAGEICKLYVETDEAVTDLSVNVSETTIPQDYYMLSCNSNLGSDIVNCYDETNEKRLLYTAAYHDFRLVADIPEGYYISSIDFTDENGNALELEAYYFDITHCTVYTMPETDVYIYVTFSEISEVNQWGDNITWSFNEDYNVLTLSGTGAVQDGLVVNGSDSYYPWHDLCEGEDIIVNVEDGITSLPSGMFTDSYEVYIVLPVSITNLDKNSLSSFWSASVYYIGSKEEWKEITGLNYCGSYNITYDYTEPDRSVLEAVVEKAENEYKAEDYTQSSYNTFCSLRNNAKSYLYRPATQQEIDNVIERAIDSFYSLVPLLKLTVTFENGTVDGFVSGETVTYAMGDTVTLSANSDYGYQFNGWYNTVSHRIVSNNMVYTFKISSNTKLEPLFKESTTVTLTFANESGYIIKRISKTRNEWNNVSSLDEYLPPVPYQLGYTNGSWTNIDLMAALEALRFGNDYTVYPNYEDYDPFLYGDPVANGNTPALDLNYEYNSTSSVGSFIMAADIPSNCNVQEVGIAFYYKKADKFDPTDFLLLLNNKTLASTFDNFNDYLYIVNIRNFTSKYNWAARGYITYIDRYNSFKTVYSNQINIVDCHDADINEDPTDPGHEEPEDPIDPGDREEGE